jgi:hypothetical protein
VAASVCQFEGACGVGGRRSPTGHPSATPPPLSSTCSSGRPHALEKQRAAAAKREGAFHVLHHPFRTLYFLLKSKSTIAARASVARHAGRRVGTGKCGEGGTYAWVYVGVSACVIERLWEGVYIYTCIHIHIHIHIHVHIHVHTHTHTCATRSRAEASACLTSSSSTANSRISASHASSPLLKPPPSRSPIASPSQSWTVRLLSSTSARGPPSLSFLALMLQTRHQKRPIK